MSGGRGAPIQNAIFLAALVALVALAISSALFLKMPPQEENAAVAPSPPTVVVVVVNADGTVRTTTPVNGPQSAPNVQPPASPAR